jgi:hypothetical protein
LSARLPTKLRVNALVRAAQAAGDFAVVVRKGEESAGQLLLLARQRNGLIQVYNRTMNSRGDYSWTIAATAQEPDTQAVDDYLERQQRYDPDLWIVELDTANPERFVDDELI